MAFRTKFDYFKYLVMLMGCYEPTKYGTTRAYRMQAMGARQVGTGRTGVPRSRAKY
jgi:hypothetical protein